MVIIAQGEIHPNTLIEYLNDKLNNSDKYETYEYPYQMPHDLLFIHNIDGKWSVAFKTVPDLKILLFFFLFFEDKIGLYSENVLEEVIFNFCTRAPQNFRRVFYPEYYDYGKGMAEVIEYVAQNNSRKESERRGEEWGREQEFRHREEERY